jgi:hypothetical protein
MKTANETNTSKIITTSAACRLATVGEGCERGILAQNLGDTATKRTTPGILTKPPATALEDILNTEPRRNPGEPTESGDKHGATIKETCLSREQSLPGRRL